MRTSFITSAALVTLLPVITGCGKKSTVVVPSVETPGADCPWTTQQAEHCDTNAEVMGPSFEYLNPASEASGRSYVSLQKKGDYLEFNAAKASNAIVLRYSIPDAPVGGGSDATLSLDINGKFARKLDLTSRYSWIYGDFPWSNDPSKGKAHHFFDESHALIPDVASGDTIRLRVGENDKAAFYHVDLIELEQAPPPLARPAESLCLTEFGAKPGDPADASGALARCIEAAQTQRKSVWIPAGVFRLDGPRIKVGGVRVAGAGIWHTTLTGKSTMFEGTGEPVEFSDLAIFGEVDRRVDELPENAFDGNFGKGSVFKNLWIEHQKCGFWTRHGTSHMRVERCRIRNVMADALNYCDGTSDSVVEQCHIRNSGDDALATWSPSGDWSSKTLCQRNRFLNNTIESPWLANCIAIYGGADHEVTGNLLSGTVFSGGGILVSSGFDALPFARSIRIDNNTIRDAGGDCYIGEAIGALWIHAKQSDINATVAISNLRIEGGPKSGLSVHGPMALKHLELSDVSISGIAGHGIDIRSNASGSLNASGLEITGAGLDPVRNESSGRFVVTGVEAVSRK